MKAIKLFFLFTMLQVAPLPATQVTQNELKWNYIKGTAVACIITMVMIYGGDETSNNGLPNRKIVSIPACPQDWQSYAQEKVIAEFWSQPLPFQKNSCPFVPDNVSCPLKRFSPVGSDPSRTNYLFPVIRHNEMRKRAQAAVKAAYAHKQKNAAAPYKKRA